MHYGCKLRYAMNLIQMYLSMTLRGGYYNHDLRQVANLFNKVILCIQEHAVMFVQVYAYPFIGKRNMNV